MATELVNQSEGTGGPFARSGGPLLSLVVSGLAKRTQTCRSRSIDPYPDLPACAGCGRCCHLVVELRAGDVVPEYFVVEHDGVRCMEQRSDGACIALDPSSLLCTIYAARPQTCRDFNRGGSLCRKIVAKTKISEAGRSVRG